jgi:hypothetical protein
LDGVRRSAVRAGPGRWGVRRGKRGCLGPQRCVVWVPVGSAAAAVSEAPGRLGNTFNMPLTVTRGTLVSLIVRRAFGPESSPGSPETRGILLLADGLLDLPLRVVEDHVALAGMGSSRRGAAGCPTRVTNSRKRRQLAAGPSFLPPADNPRTPAKGVEPLDSPAPEHPNLAREAPMRCHPDGRAGRSRAMWIVLARIRSNSL